MIKCANCATTIMEVLAEAGLLKVVRVTGVENMSADREETKEEYGYLVSWDEKDEEA